MSIKVKRNSIYLKDKYGVLRPIGIFCTREDENIEAFENYLEQAKAELEAKKEEILMAIEGTTEAKRLYYVQDTVNENKASSTQTLRVPYDDYLLVCTALAGGSNVNVDGTGWTKLTTSTGATTISGEPGVDGAIVQKVSVWYKKVNKGYHTVTVSQTESNKKLSVKLFAIKSASDLSVAEDKQVTNMPVTAINKTSKRRLYLASSVFMTLKLNNNISVEMMESPLFSAYYDSERLTENVPAFALAHDEWLQDYSKTVEILTLDVLD